MAKAALKDYFTQHGQRRALEAYSKFAKGTAWSVELKMDLYDLAKKAFSNAGNFAAFESNYNNLNSHWQVFRPHGAELCWPAPKIFEVVCHELPGFEQASGVSLMNFDGSKKHALMFSLMALEGLKPNNDYPTMAVSKFIHFYNPSLFPIWDNEVVEYKVFARFRSDYRAFCDDADLKSTADGAAFLRNYVCWASSLMMTAAPDFMSGFVAWLENELPRRRYAELDTAFLGTLYATAFEFTAIGAAKAEGY